jgi:transcriptional regulator with XRE-family HTH domain
MSKPYEGIAPRIRGLRDAVGLSRAELAERTGFGVQEVERFESGGHEIPVSFLFEVAKACGVDTTVLITGDESHLTNFALVRAGEGLAAERRRDYAYKSLAHRFVGRTMEPFAVTVPAKEAGDLTFSRHPGQEFIYVLQGRLEITLGDKVLEMGAHDSLYFDSRTPHALRGLNGEEAVFLDVII